MILDEDKKKLFELVRTKLGAPIRIVQLEDEQLCQLLDSVVQDYSSIVQNWIIENNWVNLYGQTMSTLDLAFALSVRGLQMSKDYSQWFSKEVGLQQQGKWELKKDYFMVESGKQTYVIPKGREINKVLYVTPPSITPALMGAYGLSAGAGLGDASLGAWGGLGFGHGSGFYAIPLYDTLMYATDINMKQRAMRSDLVYTVTAGPDGTHLIHLMSTPGSPFSYGPRNGGVSSGWLDRFVNCVVWYTYYDTTDDNVDECRRNNPDVYLSPDQIPLDALEYSYMNDATKAIIRQWLVAEAKILLGIIRGTNSGKIPIANAELQLDYNMLLNQGKEEKEEVKKELTERLIRMNPENQMEKMAKIVENQMKIKGVQPFPNPIIVV